MRKPTRKSRAWNRIHEYKLNKRKHRRTKTTRTRRARQHADGTVAGAPRAAHPPGAQSPTLQFRHRGSGLSGTRVRILCPENLSLEHNFDKVTELLSTIRDQSYWSKKKLYIDFRPIRQVTPSGALVLAAELDRVNHLKVGRPLKQIDAVRWDPNVRRLLKEMGFFELLRTSSPTDEPIASDDRYIQFRSGERVDGEVVDEMRRFDLDPHVIVPNNRLLFSAITEAMTNVRQHAYGDHRSYSPAPRFWWLSASFNTKKQEITVMIYDQGSGIPKTLTKNWGESLRQLIPAGLVDDHARLIEAAHGLSRSSTGERHRGRGFERDIRHYIANLDEGHGMYRIISGKGEYTAESGPGGRTNKRSFRGYLKGTFIQWRIQLT